MSDINDFQKAVVLFGCFMDGILTEAETISAFAGYDDSVIECLPKGPFRQKVTQLKEAVARGETFIISSHCGPGHEH